MEESVSAPLGANSRPGRVDDSGLEEDVFQWESQCLICERTENKKNTKTKLTKISAKCSDGIRKKILKAAAIRKDDTVLSRLSPNKDLFSISAHYHLPCYQNYIAKRNLDALTRSQDSVSIHDRVAEETLELFARKLEDGELILFPVLCIAYRQILARESGAEDPNTKATYIKSKIQKIGGDGIVFYSHNGKPDVVCSSSVSLGGLLHKLIEMIESTESTEKSESSREEYESEEVTLHKAAGILRNHIGLLPPTSQYPLPSEVSLESSRQFVPIILQKLMSWLIDEQSFLSGDVVHDNAEAERQMLTLAECIIYCSRRGKTGVTPPFHYGLMLQMFHEFGSRKVIEILHTTGFSASYDELKSFLTAAAEQELSQNSEVHVPSGLIHRNEGGAFIQEGDDNVDINAETLDGKNTFHSMARVLFQNQIVGTRQKLPFLQRQTRRSINPEYNDAIFKLIPFQKPPIRPKPPQFQDATTTIDSLIERSNELLNQDWTWVVLRSIGRGLFDESMIQSQVIPCWTVWYARFADSSNVITTPHYTPAINAKPSEMKTVYTTLKKGQEVTKACGQDYQVHTFDQQLYAVAQQVKFARPEEFSTLTLCLAPFHSACTFIGCINKLWGDSGLLDMLVESGVYAGNSAERMLLGKQYSRSVRGLTMCYEVLSQLMMENCLEWLRSTGRIEEVDETLIQSCMSAREEFTRYAFTEENRERLVTQTNEVLIPLLNEFRSIGRARSPTFHHWDSCLTALQLLLDQIRAVRESNWDLHVTSQAAVLPYYFACDRQNYSRWAPLYVLEMATDLPDEVHAEFMAGNFAIKLTQGAFKGLASDMAVEMSVTKDSKGDSGIIGLTSRD